MSRTEKKPRTIRSACCRPQAIESLNSSISFFRDETRDRGDSEAKKIEDESTEEDYLAVLRPLLVSAFWLLGEIQMHKKLIFIYLFLSKSGFHYTGKENASTKSKAIQGWKCTYGAQRPTTFSKAQRAINQKTLEVMPHSLDFFRFREKSEAAPDQRLELASCSYFEDDGDTEVVPKYINALPA